MAWGPKQKETSPTRRLIAEIPEPLFKALKLRAAVEEALIKHLVAEALRCFLNLQEEGEQSAQD